MGCHGKEQEEPVGKQGEVNKFGGGTQGDRQVLIQNKGREGLIIERAEER